MTIIIGIAIIFGQYATASRAGLEGLERMEFIALSDVISKFINVGLSLLFIFLGFDIFAIAFVSILTVLVQHQDFQIYLMWWSIVH